MLMIRLQRVGRVNDPSFRIVVTEKEQGPKSGNFLELLGSYDPRRDVKAVKAERVKHWIEKGAQISDTVYNILVDEKLVSGKKKNVLPRKSPPVKEEDKKPQTPVAAAPASAAPAAEVPAPAPEAPTEPAPETPAEPEVAPVENTQ